MLNSSCRLVLLIQLYVNAVLCVPPPAPRNGSSLSNISSMSGVPLHRLLRSVVCKTYWVHESGDIYDQEISGYSIRVDGTCDVSDYATYLAATIVKRMTLHMPQKIFVKLAAYASVGVFTASETLCVYPDYYPYVNPVECGTGCDGSCSDSCTFDGRKMCTLAGSGGQRAVILDDNLMCNGADPYYGTENIFVHEFAHTVHEYGLDYDMKNRITRAYNAARAADTWTDQYAMATEHEYFAVATTVFFNADHRNEFHDGPQMNKCGAGYCSTEAEGKYNLYSHDQELYNIVASVFDPTNPNREHHIGVCTKY